MEGKEVRFGAAMSALYATATTGTSTGAVNAMHDSFMPLGGLVPLFNMLLGCISPGGVGAGLYGFLVLAVVAVFVAGLMVGRTPEYLGKKIETREMKLAMLAVLIYPLTVLGFSAASVHAEDRRSTASATPGPHGLSGDPLRLRLGQRQQRLGLRRPDRQHALGTIRRSASPCARPLRLSSSRCWRWRARSPPRRRRPASAGTFPTHGPLFVGLLLGVIVILYLLQYFPALALGPIVEHFLLHAGKAF